MSGPLDFTNENIENTYQRVLQTDGTSVYDGTGSLFTITAVAAPAGPDQSVQFNDAGATSGSGNFTFNKNTNTISISGSLVSSGSVLFPAITTTNQVNVLTIDTASGQLYYTASSAFGGTTVAPGNPNGSIQFNGNGVFSGSNNLTFDSASNALTLTGSLNVSGSTFQIGNNNLIGNTSLSGSINISGSSTIRGNTTMTGSLLITGSTTQIGNNTLLGNTILTGSIVISGSFPVGSYSSSVNIYGDTSMTGYLKFNPQTTNIDTSISASYIFVSGSTNDLYFSQNGNGYSNTTRLRWLEGNLYTGLLNGGIISQVNTHTYQVSSGSGVIVSLNASYNDNPYPTIQYLNWGNLTKTIDALSSSFDQQFVAIDSTSNIFAQGTPYNDGDYNTKIPIGIVIHQNRSTINAVQTFPSVGYGWKQRSFDFIKAFGPLKISGYTLAQSGSSTRGLTLAGGTAWVDGRNYIVDPNNPSYITEATGITTSKIYRYRQSGSGWAYDTNAGVGYTDIDPTQYSNNGVLTTVPTNDWTLQRVFYFPNSATKAFYIYYGNASYASKTDAIAAISTETFNEAPNTAANAIFVGYMILRYNASFNTAASYEFRAAGLFRSSGAGGGGGGGTTAPGGSNTQIQYNNNGAFGGVSNLTWDGTTLSATGSFTGSFTGSLLGTASYATTASYALNGGVTQILAGPNISLSPSNGLGQVTISSTGGGGGGNTATSSYGSFYDTTIQTIGTAGAVYSMSLNNAPISNGVSISGSVSPYNTYIKTANAGVYDIQFSAQIDKTTGTTGIVYIWLRKNGTDLSETNTAVTLAGGANDKALAAWNWFVNANAGDYFQIMWAATQTNIRLYSTGSGAIDAAPAIPSLIVTANRVDQFLSNTGSFTGSFTGELIGTASWAYSASNALIAQTASFVTASNVYGPYGSNSILSASYAISSSFSQTSSFYQETDPVFVAKSASLATTGSNIFTGTQTITGSVFITGSTQGGGSGHILTYNTSSGQLFFTASSAIGGGGGDVSNLKSGSFGITIDGNGGVITIGQKGYITVPYNGTISDWQMVADQTGSCLIDIRKSTFAGFPTQTSITGSAPVSMSSAQKASSSILTGWTSSISAGDIFGFTLISASLITRLNLIIDTIKS